MNRSPRSLFLYFFIFVCYAQNNPDESVVLDKWVNTNFFEVAYLASPPFNGYILRELLILYKVERNKSRAKSCPMIPHCSKYALSLVNEYGIFALPLIADRLARCGHDIETYDQLVQFQSLGKPSQLRYLDLPKNEISPEQIPINHKKLRKH